VSNERFTVSTQNRATWQVRRAPKCRGLHRRTLSRRPTIQRDAFRRSTAFARCSYHRLFSARIRVSWGEAATLASRRVPRVFNARTRRTARAVVNGNGTHARFRLLFAVYYGTPFSPCYNCRCAVCRHAAIMVIRINNVCLYSCLIWRCCGKRANTYSPTATARPPAALPALPASEACHHEPP